MQTRNIASGLPEICMLDAICRHDEQHIAGQRCFHAERGFAAMEACAQLCALHARWRRTFGCHAFLLAVTSLTPLPPKILNGLGTFSAHLKGATRQACTYAAEIRLEDHPVIHAAMTIGLKDYDERFQEANLRSSYQHLFSRLSDGL